MKKIGIWMDREKAYIINIDNGKEHITTVFSKIENFHIGGGSGSRFKGGPQDVVQDSKYLEREGHQLTAFFKEIASRISGADAIMIFGPAQAGQKLDDELSKKYASLHHKVKSVEKADNMTDNQTKQARSSGADR